MAMKAIPKSLDARRRFWRRVVKRWEQSGLDSMVEFCQQQKVPVRQFYNWRQRLMAVETTAGEMRFVPVVATEGSPAVSVTAPVAAGIRIDIGNSIGITLQDGFDPKLLRNVVAALT